MFPSLPSSSAGWISGIAALLLVGGFALQGQLATSSLPPPEVGPSGLLLRQASSEQIDALSTGLKPGWHIEATRAIMASSSGASAQEGRAWYVGARLRKPGRSEQVAVWLVTGPKTRPRLLYSVGPAARTASAWPAVSRSGASVRPSDPEPLALFSALRAR